MRLRKCRQMADGPGDHVAVAMQISIALIAGAENARDIPRHRRLFG
jgi:hypothetical protein